MSNMSSNGNNMGNNTKGSRPTKRPTPLKTTKEEVRQYRPPVIIHTYSPKVIHVDAAQFSSLVQRMTGKRKPEASPRVVDFPASDDLPCPSPSSSGDSSHMGSFVEGQLGLFSPRGPLAPFDLYNPGKEATSLPSPYHGSAAPTNVFTNAMFAAKAAASAVPQYSPLSFNSFPGSFSHLFSPIPSPNILSPNFLADLPALSPGGFQGFDAIMPSPAYNRFPGAGGIIPSPGAANAFKDFPWLTSRD